MVKEVGQQVALKLQFANGAASTPAKSESSESGKKMEPTVTALPPGGNNVPSDAAGRTEGDAAQIKELVSNLNDMVQSVHRELKFTVDEDTGRTVIRVINSDTDEVIRQIPPDEILAIARNFTGSEGLLLNTKV